MHIQPNIFSLALVGSAPGPPEYEQHIAILQLTPLLHFSPQKVLL